MSASPQHWVAQARYDLDTARAMLGAGRYLYVLFCCQQAVEKMLKAVIAGRSRELPPRLHQLVRLAEVAALELDDQRTDFMRELSAYYIQARYPEESADPTLQVKEATAERVLEHTEGTCSG